MHQILICKCGAADGNHGRPNCAVHALEASYNFQGHLHNGDPLGARTVNVPANRPARWNPPTDWLSSAVDDGDPLGARTVNVPANRPARWNPPTDWLSSAVDAITGEGFAGPHDWSLARALYRFEGYNGYSYHTKNINSPYLWSFSNHYTRGKFVRDHVYDHSAVSAQCGAAVMLTALQMAGDITL